MCVSRGEKAVEVGSAAELRKANLSQRTTIALRLESSRRHTRDFKQHTQGCDQMLCKCAKCVVEHNDRALVRCSVEDQPFRHRQAEHLFQTKRLGAELHVVVGPAGFTTTLVFDGTESRDAV